MCEANSFRSDALLHACLSIELSEKQEAKSLWHDDETNKKDKGEKVATRDMALAQERQDLPTIDNTLSIVFTPLELKRSSQKSWQYDQQKIVRFFFFLFFYYYYIFQFSNFVKLIKRSK